MVKLSQYIHRVGLKKHDIVRTIFVFATNKSHLLCVINIGNKIKEIFLIGAQNKIL